MIDQQRQYQQIARAITYIQENFQQQPSLADVAAAVNLSPFHFQRLFTDWAGVSPKKFIQFSSVEYAKSLLQGSSTSLLDVALQTGLSGTGRLHDLFINIEGMTPGEYKNAGQALTIHYSFQESIFGSIIVASTGKGVCHMAFYEERALAQSELFARFANAVFVAGESSCQRRALAIFSKDWSADDSAQQQLKLHLKGTEFQLKVWHSLLKIPLGNLSSYGQVAAAIGKPSASRAVGTAIGNNPVAFLIPCHRVLQASGKLGGYRWQPLRKSVLIAWEGAKVNAQDK